MATNRNVFQVGGISFEAVQKERPRKHWALKLAGAENTFTPGTAGISTESRPKMKSDLEYLFIRCAKSDVNEWKRQWEVTK